MSIENGDQKQNDTTSAFGRQVSIQLTDDQFERLYLQPGSQRAPENMVKRFGNPSVFGLGCYVATVTPISILLMQIQDTDLTAMGAFSGIMFMVGGLGLWISGLLEFVLGNTLPCTFCMFGSYFLSVAYINSPQTGITASLEGGVANPSLNGCLGAYMVTWGVISVIFTIGSIRTNLCLVAVLFSIALAFFLLAAGYYETAHANIEYANTLLRAAGALCLVCTIPGWYLFTALVMEAGGIPLKMGVLDTSQWFTKKTQ